MPRIPNDPTNKLTRINAANSNIDPAIEQAAKELTEKYGHTGTRFGVPTKNAKQIIYAYAPNKKVLKGIPDEINGFKIIKKVIGKIKPA